LKRLGLALGLIVVVVALVVGAVLFSNAPPRTSNNVNVLSFTYTVSNNTFTFYAADGFTNYTWNFGDSSTGAGSVVSHTYQTNGNYQVTLIADPLTGPSGSLSVFQQVLVTTVTTLVHHYFENLNVTMGGTAT
jgi:PKD repeat protein